MHDLDRTQSMFEWEAEEPEYAMEFEEGFGEELEFSEELEQESPFDEATEMELASELLSVSDEAELEQFLGSLIKKVGRSVGKLIKSPVGRALVSGLKGVAKKVLPIAGGALGGWVGGPAGAALGSKLASMAGKTFGLELEGLSPEDQEFETARRVVRLAGAAARHAASVPPSVSAAVAAQKALSYAARRHAPGLIRGFGGLPVPMPGRGGSGRWIRRGRKIILFGV